MLDSPSWVTPADPGTPHPLHEAIEWDWFDAQSPWSTLALVRNQKVVWYVAAGKDATSLTVPALPSGVTDAQVLGNSPGGVLYGGILNDEETAWAQYVQSPQIALTP